MIKKFNHWLDGDVNSSRQTSGFNWILFAFGAVITTVFLVFPQFPARIRELAALVVLLSPGVVLLYRARALYLSIIHVGVIIAAGLVMWSVGGGNVMDPMYPVRSLLISVGVLVFLRTGSAIITGWFMACWSVIQLLALIVDIKRGPITKYIPFGIFSEQEMALREVRFFADERPGGLTFEAGVLASMAAFFLCVVIVRIVAGYMGRWRKPAPAELLPLAITTCFCLMLLLLTKSKSGLAALAGFISFALLGFIFLGKSKLQTKVIAGGVAFAALFALILLLKPIANKLGVGDYLKDEAVRVTNLSQMASDDYRSGGLGTRIEYAKAAAVGVLHYPFGVGSVGGIYLIEKVGDSITPTPEMKWSFEKGAYDGFKGYLLNVMVRGGILGVLTFFAMLLAIVHFASRISSGEYIWGLALAIAISIIGLSTELIPLWEMVVFAFGYLAQVFNVGGVPLRGNALNRHGRAIRATQ
jgi:hypothetical protein